jgi:hypothetical protein
MLARPGPAYGRQMNRDSLAQLLDTPDYASSACRHALLGGADLIMWDGRTPADQMVPAYERRQARTVAAGLSTLGFPEALVALRDLHTEPVQLVQVTVTNPGYLFMVFLAGDPAAVVACIGIEQGPG